MVIVAQLGARMHYAVPAILQRSGMLERFYTDICAPRLPKTLQTMASRYGPASFRRWLGRVPVDIPEEKITSFGAMGLEYNWRFRRGVSRGSATAAFLWAGEQFCRRIIRRGLGNANCVYAFNSAGLELLQFARAHGALTILEQSSAPGGVYEKLRDAEEADHPRWAPARRKDPLLRVLQEREQMEWEAADLILCGSEFVRDAVRSSGGPADSCRVVPYGIRAVTTPKRHLRHSPLRVLTVGAVGIMKGTPYVLATAKHLKGKAEFRMAGALRVTPYARELLSAHVSLLGAVPRSEIYQQFAWADVFLLPSICEGSATACYEALSHGLPVITTENAGSVVRDQIDGFIVPIRDANAIADRVERLADDPDLWATMSGNALARACEFTLEKYGERLLAALECCQQVSDAGSRVLTGRCVD
jgi:glycosyltransferase involved in cell wall biosynthesis